MKPAAEDPNPANGGVRWKGRWRNPWWIPPFLGRVPDLEPRLMRALGLVALGLMFENYDISLLNSALKHIADDLEIATADLGVTLGTIRLGGLAAFFILPFADRLGRRRVFLGALLGMSVGTFATAFAQTPAQFVACQTVTRAFMLTGGAVAVVIVTEEFPAEVRGWGGEVLLAELEPGHSTTGTIAKLVG